MLTFLINYCDTIFPFLSGLLLACCFRKWQPGFGWLFTYCIVSFLLMGFGNILADQGIYNHYVYHFFTMVEAPLALTMVNTFSPKKYRHMPLVIVAFTCFTVLNMIFWEPLFASFNSNAAGLCNILISIFCLRYFVQLANDDEVLNFQKLPGFWIISGFLFYSMVTVLVLSSYKYMETLSRAELTITWKIQQVANIIRFVLLSVGIICCYRRSSPSGLLL